MERAMIGLGLAVAVVATAAVSAVPVLAQIAEDPSPSAEATEIPLTTKSGRPDLYLDMPYYIGGFEPDIVMTRGEEHWADLASDDPTRIELETFLETVGADPEDMVSGYALVLREDFSAYVVGVRVDGAEPGTLLPAYLPILIDDLEDATTSSDSIGGREVTVVSSVGEEGEYVDLYLYDQGDTIWMVPGPGDVFDVTFENLPDPLATE